MHRSSVQPIADRLINDYKFYAIQCSLANIKPFGKKDCIIHLVTAVLECKANRAFQKIKSLKYLSIHILLARNILSGFFSIGMTWSSVAADELFEHCQDKQLVAKVIMHILHCFNE